MKNKRGFFLLFLLLCMGLTWIPAGAEQTMYMSGVYAKVYKKASSSSGKLGYLSYGEHVTFISKKGSWAQVRNDSGTVGFCKYSSLTARDPNNTRKTYYASKAGVPVYRHAMTSSKQLGKLNKADAVIAVASTKNGKWRRIEYNGGYGYVQSSKLTTKQPEIPTTMYVSANTTIVYKSASKKAKKLQTLNFGDSLVREKTSGSWAKVKVSGVTGWVAKSDIVREDPSGEPVTWYASSGGAQVCAAPTASAKKLGALKKDQEISVVAETADGMWKRVEYQSGYGFVQKTSVTAQPPIVKQPAPGGGYADPYKGTAGATLERVIALALAQYGKPYVWGTAGPNTYDCSGLTSYAFRQGTGIALKRSAYEQGYDRTFKQITDPRSLRRGDVVFFNTVATDVDLSDHAGLYLGGGYFVHASSGQGKVVVSTLSDGYYSRVFSWGSRIIP